MKYCILMGSPRKNGNTASLLNVFVNALEKAGSDVSCIWLYDKNIKPCIGCKNCQNNWDGFGCVLEDDMQDIFDQVYESDFLILATPIYSWYCTSPMKASLDRLAYGMNKYYGEKKGPSLWKGKRCAIIATCGYRPEKGADVFEEGIIRYCKHSSLIYSGMLSARDKGDQSSFMSRQTAEKTEKFAESLLNMRLDANN
ncbi:MULTISPECIES: flavodoxin family protein [unclassified Sedimentibacter]|uniref:flavodoxin family protein n=1 Tax=unclassified Sedimentibacter TaxID=2649220 RepID=UPI0027DF8DA9|nr:flavodoxin family protein [Sedimentibacter sp. MB35-C1]WMJ78723.1 flavodoxin family protein [Sedimentibacter sp. MB35-C1]